MKNGFLTRGRQRLLLLLLMLPVLAAGPAAAQTVADTAFVLRQADFGPEGIAYEAQRDAYWVSSMRSGRIVQVRAGAASPFAALASGWSALGLAVDTSRARLWVAASALPQAEGYQEAEAGRSALIAFDLDSGHEVARVAGPPGSTLGDLALHLDGTIYTSDGLNGAVYALAPGADTLHTLVPPGVLRSAQGLAVDAAGTALFVADYAIGIFRLDLLSGTLVLLRHDGQRRLWGIDGLVRDGADLLAVQNARGQFSVLRFRLREDRIARVEVLLEGHPALDEPTLGTLVGEDFVFVASSLWGHLNEQNEIEASHPPPVFLKIGLR